MDTLDHRSIGPLPPGDPAGPPPPRSRRQRSLTALCTAAVLLGLTAVGYLAPDLLPPADRSAPSVTGPDAAAPPTPITYWPSASTTGVPDGTVLRASGPLSLRTDNQVVSGLDIAGCVNVHAHNVRITRSRITCDSPAYAIRTLDTAVNLVVEDVEIDGVGRTGVAVCCGNYTLRRVNVHGTTDGPRLGSNSVVVDSYIHGLARAPGSHNDALQTTGAVNITVRHNTLQVYDPVTDDPMNACLMLGSETAPEVRNLIFEQNYCDGGNWSIGIRSDMTAHNIVFRDNKFGRNYRYGVVARPQHPGFTWERSNVWFDNGLPVLR